MRPALLPRCMLKFAMSGASPVYLEIIDFIAAGTTPDAVVRFRPSLEAQQRVAELVEREKAAGLSPDEKAELDHFLELEHRACLENGKSQGPANSLPIAASSPPPRPLPPRSPR